MISGPAMVPKNNTTLHIIFPIVGMNAARSLQKTVVHVVVIGLIDEVGDEVQGSGSRNSTHALFAICLYRVDGVIASLAGCREDAAGVLIQNGGEPWRPAALGVIVDCDHKVARSIDLDGNLSSM